MITEIQLNEWATRHGYTLDKRTGYFTKVDTSGRKWRMHVSRSAVRFEWQLKTEQPWGKTEYRWIRHRSGYLRDAYVDSNDELKGVTAAGCGK